MKSLSPVLIFLLLTFICISANSSDLELIPSANDPVTNLYRVEIRSQADADALSSCPCDVLLKVKGGYLVLASSNGEEWLIEKGMSVELTAPDVNRHDIAMDMRMDAENIDKYPILFDEGGIRLFRVDFSQIDRTTGKANIVPLRDRQIPIVYRPQRSFAPLKAMNILDLDSLVGKMRQDSLESYSYRLEAFNGRPAGSASVQACALWLVQKFQDFGYDSIAVDVYWDSLYGEWAQLRNVIAYKTGTIYPDFHVVVGAHYDAEPGSPGADDNGSGTAAVLEIARVLADVETNVTYVFALWDAEEEGLLGAWQYANRAYNQGERIILNVNMDMIAHYQNSADGKVYSNNENYSQLVVNLADSLSNINLNFHSGGAGGTDYIPFEQSGYEVINIHEYIFSTVYHSYLDNTDYLNFDYMTRMARTALVAGYVISENFVPDPELVLASPGGLPQVLNPRTPTTVEININAYGGAGVVPGSVQLHYAPNDGEWMSTTMTDLGGTYSSILPSLECADRVIYYITAEEYSLGAYYYPAPNSYAYACAATGLVTVFEDDFSADLGWTVTSDAVRGDWERAQTSTNGTGGTPTSDYDGNRYCYLTESNFGADVDGGSTSLISPTIDGSGGNILMQYARWFSNSTGEAPFSDILNIYISNNDGGSWRPLETVGPEYQADGGWYVYKFWSDDEIEPTDQMRLRFTVTDNGDDSQVEAAIDAVKVIRFTFAPQIITESLPHWTAGVPYGQQLEAVACAGGLTWVDKYGHLVGSGLSVSPEGMVTGTPTEEGIILFATGLTDELGQEDETMYSLVISPALELTTDAIPMANVGIQYSYQLIATGGTGIHSWADVNDDLAGTGLEITTDGLLNGTPTDVGVVNFTARVEDEIGAADERPFTIDMEMYFVCGDANGDGQVNVGDAVRLINYVFSGGAAPEPLESGDANCDGNADVGDAVYLIAYVFKGGPAPCCP